MEHLLWYDAPATDWEREALPIGNGRIGAMLLQSEDGELRILPALPAAWPDGSVTGLRARGAVRVDIAWADSELTEVSVTSEHDRLLDLRLDSARPAWLPRDVWAEAGRTYTWRR
jgi:alpha-L-fucosidase 2